MKITGSRIETDTQWINLTEGRQKHTLKARLLGWLAVGVRFVMIC
jgi:hypothetical protein